MNPREVLRILNGLRVLPYFPSDEYVMNALVRLCGSMCENLEQVRWLVDRMTSGIYAQWPGPAEMRACLCCRYKPKDGVSAYSSVYPDGLPPDPTAPPRTGIASATLKALPPGHVASADPQAEAAVMAAVELLKRRQVPFDAPVTDAEIEAAPEWLRRLEGYDNPSR